MADESKKLQSGYGRHPIVAVPDPSYAKSLLTSPPTNSPGIDATISALGLQDHPEGGFFVETDRDPRLVPNPFLESQPKSNNINSQIHNTHTSRATKEDPNAQAYNFSIASKKSTDIYRHASTSIHYLLTPSSPISRWHRNKGRTIFTLHWGRGVYTVLHPPDPKSATEQIELSPTGNPRWRMEVFTVGKDLAKGERLQWIVEGGCYKAVYLLPDSDDTALSRQPYAAIQTNTEDPDMKRSTEAGGSEAGLLISETVIPGFEYSDHNFLTADDLLQQLGRKAYSELEWLLRNEEAQKLSN